jgi:hypothetical protein
MVIKWGEGGGGRGTGRGRGRKTDSLQTDSGWLEGVPLEQITWAWWHAAVIPATWEAEVEGSRGQPGYHSKTMSQKIKTKQE